MQHIALCLLPQGRLFPFILCSHPYLFLLSPAQLSICMMMFHSFLFLALWVGCDKYSHWFSPLVCSLPLSLGVLVPQDKQWAPRVQGWSEINKEQCVKISFRWLFFSGGMVWVSIQVFQCISSCLYGHGGCEERAGDWTWDGVKSELALFVSGLGIVQLYLAFKTTPWHSTSLKNMNEG